MRWSTVTLTALAALVGGPVVVSATYFTSPTTRTTWDTAAGQVITWHYQAGGAPQGDILLEIVTRNPKAAQTLVVGSDVDLTSGSLTVPADLDSSEGKYWNLLMVSSDDYDTVYTQVENILINSFASGGSTDSSSSASAAASSASISTSTRSSGGAVGNGSGEDDTATNPAVGTSTAASAASSSSSSATAAGSSVSSSASSTTDSVSDSASSTPALVTATVLSTASGVLITLLPSNTSASSALSTVTVTATGQVGALSSAAVAASAGSTSSSGAASCYGVCFTRWWAGVFGAVVLALGTSLW